MTSPLSRREFVHCAAATLATTALPLHATPSASAAAGTVVGNALLDDDLLEVTIARLHALYDARKYTVTQVTRWYLDRIARYNPVYRAIAHVDTAGALAAAARLDAAARGVPSGQRPPLWGVPIVIKSNTSVKGLVTNDGWWGFVVPGQELVAPTDATVVAKLRAAGAVILGQTNMPDFAASDTNFSTVYGRTGNAYDVRCSPGGSSGGTVTAVTANLCVLGTGTDTANSIRMPAGTSNVVGVLPTRGLTSIAGIAPLDWLLDNTGPIARTVADAAIALDVMRGTDPKDFRTAEAVNHAQPGPYVRSLNTASLKDRRFGVPAFMLAPPTGTPQDEWRALRPDTRALFTRAVDELRAAGAVVVFHAELLPDSFRSLAEKVDSRRYVAEGTRAFLSTFGPPLYRTPEQYAQVVGAPLPPVMMGGPPRPGTAAVPPIASDPDAEAHFWTPQRSARAAYDDALERFGLDGLVYPAAQMPPNDELELLARGQRSSGPHSDTGWVNPIGVPAVVVPAGFYDNGLPFGLELSARRWRDGDLLGWAHAYERATHHRRPPLLRDTR